MSFRSRLRPLKRGVALLLHELWQLVFGVVGYLTRSKVARWHSAGGQRILVVAPHPDDEAIGCVGAMLMHVRAGDYVCAAVATDGRQSKAFANADDMARQRRREFEEAALHLQVHRSDWLGLPEGNWSAASLSDLLSKLLAEIKPDIVYAPSRIDFHPEHLKVAHALALALRTTTTGVVREPLLRIYQAQVPLTPALCNLVADVSALRAQCDAVLRVYVSQAGSLQGPYRSRRYSAQLYGTATHAEEFWEMSAARYIGLHETAPEQWPHAFRGIRHFPLTDPLAYLVGLKERHKVHALCDARVTN
jgi:LmbE family N-acetylglucosaminyl deacetylase